MTEPDHGVKRRSGAADLEGDLSEGELTESGADPSHSGTTETRPSNQVVDEDDVNRVADALRRTGGTANHPDGPGVGGD